MIPPQDVHLRVDILHRPAQQEETELRREGNGNRNDGRQEEVLGVVRRAGGEVPRRHDDQDQRDGKHDEREDNVSRRGDARAAGGVPPRVDLVHRAVRHEEHQPGKRVEDGVGHGDEQRQRAGRDGGVELQPGQDDVGREGPLYADGVHEVVPAVRVLDLLLVLVHGLEHGADRLVLALVELLDARAPRAPRLPLARAVGPDL